MPYIFKKEVRGLMYYYLGENKKVNGVSRRVWQKYVGTAKTIQELLEQGNIPSEIDSLEFGLCAALLKINDELDFVGIADKVLDKREQGLSYGEHLLITVINRIANPSSHNKFSGWFDSTFLKRLFQVKKSYLSSQTFWNHWKDISDEEINNIQELLLEKIISMCDISELCFDPTNFSTYIEEHKNQRIMQFGHAKDGRKGFRQVNLSLLVTKNEGIPLWHHTYDGNINDVAEFKEFIKLLINRISFFSKKCKKITLVMDKGNNSKKNISNINKKLHFFIVGSLKPSEFGEYLDIPLEEFKEEYHTAKDKKVYCVSRLAEIYEGKKKIVVTYSSELAYKNKVRVEKALNNALNKLKNLQSRIKNSRLTRDEILIKAHDIADRQYLKGLIKYEIGLGNSLKFEVDNLVYKKLSKGFGKNILFTDDLTLSSEETVRLYNSKHIIEEQFKNLKDTRVISFTPMWCWTDQMIRVHAFTCVMALLFLRILCMKAKPLNLSQDEILEQLQKIKLIILASKDGASTKITRLNEIQKQLAEIFSLKSYS